MVVVTGLMEALFHIAKNSATERDNLIRHIVFGAIVALGILLLLSKNRIEVVPSQGKIEIFKGIWPFVGRSERSLALADKLRVHSFSTNQGSRGYNVILSYSDGRTLRLLHTLDQNDLKRVRDLAGALSIPVEVTGGMIYSPNDPAWDILGVQPPNNPLP